MVIIPHNFKILLSLLWLSLSRISKCCQPSTWSFFRSVIPLNFFFFKTGKNNLSIIITIVGNINVLVSHNVIFFGYFMPETWCQLEDSSNCLPPIALSPFRFSPGLSVVLLKILSQPSFALIKLFAKNNIFSK